MREGIYGPVLHLDIIDNKIWIQQDGTEVGIANELVELGVPKQDIILISVGIILATGC